jgi:hypothetical protein
MLVFAPKVQPALVPPMSWISHRRRLPLYGRSGLAPARLTVVLRTITAVALTRVRAGRLAYAVPTSGAGSRLKAERKAQARPGQATPRRPDGLYERPCRS